MSQPTHGSSVPSSISVGLILITLASLILVGYTSLNPHLSTVTQQQFLTNTQSIYSTQTQTQTQSVTSIGTQTLTVTVTTTSTTGIGYGYYQGCGYYGCPSPGYTSYYGCQSLSSSRDTVQCYGYLYKDSAGCIELAVPVNNGYYFETQVYQYYTLRNLPSAYPSLGSWVTVTGQLYTGYNVGPYGAACPGNYIVVASIST